MQGAAAAVPMGDPTILETVFREHHRRVFRAAYRVTGNAADAEDVLQTVFLRLARQPASIPMDNPASYLYRAAVNSALDVLRVRRDRPSVPLEDAEEPRGADSATPDTHYRSAEVRACVRRALATLPPRTAEVFALRYLEGEQNRDIARLLGISRISVAVTLHRARLRLQDELRTLRYSR